MVQRVAGYSRGMTETGEGFGGVPPETIRFLRQLSRNNNRDWFQAHHDEYRRFLIEPAMDLVEALGEGLQALGKGIHAEPKIGGSVMRINRDIRFSKDKRPYKDHLDLWFWQGGGPSRERPGYWFRLTTKELILGAGMHDFGAKPELLQRYRDAVVDPRKGPALARAVEKVRSAGCDVGGRRFKRVPKGFDPEHPRAELLLHDGLHAGITMSHPKELHAPSFAEFCVRRYRDFTPIQEWLVGLVGR